MTDVVNPPSAESTEVNGAPVSAPAPTGQTRSGHDRRSAARGRLRPPAVLDCAARRSRSPPSTTTARCRWRCATACSGAGWPPRRTGSTCPSKVTCYLSAEFLMGPQLGNNLLNLGIEDEARAALADLGPGPRRDPGVRGGARPGQRRPGPAGRLLSRLAGHAGAPVDRLRHPLRVRHLPAGDPGRLADREDRQLAQPRQPVGDREAGRQLPRELGRPHRGVRGRRGQVPGALGAAAQSSRASPTTPRSRATASTPATR